MPFGSFSGGGRQGSSGRHGCRKREKSPKKSKMPKKIIRTNRKTEAIWAKIEPEETDSEEETQTDSEEEIQTDSEEETFEEGGKYYWKKEAEGSSKPKSLKKREEEAEKKAKAAARKAQVKILAALEEKELEKVLKKPLPKVTAVELQKHREEVEEFFKKKQNRVIDEEEYERMVFVANTNHDNPVFAVGTVDDALARIARIITNFGVPGF